MSIFLGVLAGFMLLAMLCVALVRLDAKQIATTVRMVGPILLGAIGVIMLFMGRAGVGGGLISLALGWFTWARRISSQQKSPGKTSTVRTAAIEMELDHDSGTLDGFVLAGRHEGKTLDSMSLDELNELHRELGSDPESDQLLQTYLDGRFPAWREDANADGRDRQGAAPSSGAMTKEEAYKVLGLEAGAAAADVRKAHRRLMQRLHPDLGGTSFLAARINEAKDVLLSNHN
ncbi:DnaJ domain-containing protein [Mesorhizobium sp. SB112]|uniref:DnaJ domain-containing protein n=1 Tax=Mesorhizobium sp. SB112 TaxID=3151853 RepID=UPI0032654A73